MDADNLFSIFLALVVLFLAFSSSNFGQGGGSAYLALFILAGTPSAAIIPTILILNLLVAIPATLRLYAAGSFSWRNVWPFVITSIPASFIFTRLELPPAIHLASIVLVLLGAAVIMFLRSQDSYIAKMVSASFSIDRPGNAHLIRTGPIPLAVACLVGIPLGLTVGLTGIGGGAFLGSFVTRTRLVSLDESFGISAALVSANCAAALFADLPRLANVPVDNIVYWAPAALLGGWLGIDACLRGRRAFGLSAVIGVILIIGAASAFFRVRS